MDIIIQFKNYCKNDIKFYWLEKNKTFNINVIDFIKKENSYIYSLNYIIEGKYYFYCNKDKFQFTIKKNNNILYEKKNFSYFFNIQIINDSTIIDYDSKKFHLEKKNLQELIKKKTIKKLNYYWFNLHYFALNYYPINPTESQYNQIKLLLNKMMINGITCEKCRNHFIENVNKININNIIKSRDNLVNFFLNLHNKINMENNKKQMTFNEMILFYKKSDEFESKLNNVCKPLFKFFLENKSESFPDCLNSQITFKKL